MIDNDDGESDERRRIDRKRFYKVVIIIIEKCVK